MKRLEKELKHYGEKKDFKEIKRELLGNDFLIPYKKEEIIPTIEEFKNLKSQHTEKYQECENLKRKVEVIEINSSAFEGQISVLSCIRKNLSDIIKSTAIVESELV